MIEIRPVLAFAILGLAAAGSLAVTVTAAVALVKLVKTTTRKHPPARRGRSKEQGWEGEAA